MKLAELYNLLKATSYPVAYSHFKTTEDKTIPDPPFIVYLVNADPNFIADNNVYHKISDVTIELYTNKKDLTAEEKLEFLLNENELPYTSDEVYIESEQLFQKLYEVRLI